MSLLLLLGTGASGTTGPPPPPVVGMFTVSGLEVTQLFEPVKVVSGPGVVYTQSAMHRRTN